MNINSPEAVSVCIPSYQGEAHLVDALESCLQQTYPHLEILIVDDGSADGTLAIAHDYAARHPQVRVVQNTEKKGMVANWNKCVELARHGWIKFLFQDDLLEKDCIEKMLSLCQQTGARLALCRRDFILDEQAAADTKNAFGALTKPEMIFREGVISREELARQVTKHGMENILGEPSCILFHKSLWQQAGGFAESLRQLVDFEFIIRLGLQDGMAFTPEKLASFRVHAASQTAMNRTSQAGHEAIKRNIRSVYGDELLLLHQFATKEVYEPIRKLRTEEDLRSHMKYLYLNACKKYGRKLTDEALEDVLQVLPDLKDLRYNLFVYQAVKSRYKKFRHYHKTL